MDLKAAVGQVFEEQFDADAGADRFRSGLGIDFIFDDPNDPADFAFGGWYVWVLAWFAAVITGGIGAILAALRLLVRHRTAGLTSPTSSAT